MPNLNVIISDDLKNQIEKVAARQERNKSWIVRKAIEELGGTMPEDLETPKKSIKELEKEDIKKLGNN